ncbi:IgGFc-binding protein-like [Salvelinus alpinus]
MKGSLQCFGVLLLTGLCSAGPAGKEFATAFMQNYIEDYKGSSFKIEVASPPLSLQPTMVKVTALGKDYEKTVDPGKSVTFDLPKGVEMIGSKKNLPTVLIEASQEVTVLSFNYKKETADTSVVYPVKDWGTEYFIFTPMSTAGDRFSKEFSIINYKEKNFGVEVYLTGPVTFQRQKYFAGSKLTIDLMPFESVQIQSQFDLSGTNVISKFPVGVLSGHSCTKKYTGCNHVYEQLQPVKSWGKEFIVAPLPFHKNINRYDSLYIQTSQFTQVKVMQSGIDFLTLPMFPGQSLELIVTWPNSYYLSADKGIQVLYEFNGGDVGKKQYYDPFLFTILPNDQFSTSYALEGQAGFHNMFVMVALTKDLGGFMVDTLPMPLNIEWHKVVGTEYSWAEVLYGTGASFQQISHANSPFAIYSIGGAYANGYGSPASGNPDAPECPENSHYEVCGRGCPATCEDPEGPSMCKTSCVKSCMCDKGYVLNGKKCVPLSQCGCLYNDTFYKNGQVFHPNGLCQEECTCNGKVNCVKFSCGPHETCEVKNGVRHCQAVGKGVCTISGDPHYKTFDNSLYDFQGTCTYTVAQGCHLEGTRLNPFSVVVENEKWYAMSNNPKVSVAKLVAVEVYGNTLVLRRNQAGMIMVNGIMMSLPVNLNNGAVQAYQEGTYDVITTDFGLRVTYDLVYHVIVTVPGHYRGKTCGLCGNFNDNKNDEFQLPDGKITKDLLTFGAAWKISVPHVVCEDGCSGEFCPKCDAKKKLIFEADCSIITNPHGPFATCHNVIDPTSYFRNCVYDVCLSEGDRKVLCQSISAYMIDCQDFGVNISNWRTATFCPLDCPANSHYQSCSEICANPCPGLSDIITCPTTCAEGCACNADYYFNGTGCVKWDLCSCYHKGRTYKIGESVLSEDCQELCTCTASGDVKCEATKCKADESCQVKNGHRGCYLKKCLLETNGAFTLFNGRSGAITAMGNYEIINVCDNALVEEWFRVVVTLQACGKTGLKSVVAVYVYFNDLIVTVNSKHETWINGKKVTLPRLMSNEVSVKVSDKTVMIERMSGLRVSYSLSQEIIVTVSAHMADKVCGACGRLNPSGDIPGPSFNRTMQEYMDGWNAPDFPTCSGGL